MSEVEGREGRRGEVGSFQLHDCQGLLVEELKESGSEKRTSCLAAIYKTVIWGSVSGQQKQRRVAD